MELKGKSAYLAHAFLQQVGIQFEVSSQLGKLLLQKLEPSFLDLQLMSKMGLILQHAPNSLLVLVFYFPNQLLAALVICRQNIESPFPFLLQLPVPLLEGFTFGLLFFDGMLELDNGCLKLILCDIFVLQFLLEILFVLLDAFQLLQYLGLKLVFRVIGFAESTVKLLCLVLLPRYFLLQCLVLGSQLANLLSCLPSYFLQVVQHNLQLAV